MQSLFSIKPTIIDFGKVETDTLKHKPIVVSNQGNIELKIFVHQSPDKIFHVQPDSGTVAPFDTLIFMATFKPNVKEVFDDTVIFKFLSQFNANRFDSTIVVLLKGQGIPVSVEERQDDFRPVSFMLHQNYPNPFNPSTTISYSLPKSSQVVLKIFDILGHEIASLVNERQEAGEYKIEWQAAGLQSGIYVCRLQAGEFSAVRKIILLK